MSDSLRDELERSLGPGYAVLRELGGGGMARVFLAHDHQLGRDVAVKVLNPSLAEQLLVERFAREIRLAAALQDLHIVPVLTAGQTAAGLPYYTMPFIRGESLRARLDTGAPIPLPEGLTILRNVAKALALAHAQGVWHRDIKPENVLLSAGGAVVTDFGIAKALDASRKPAETAMLTAVGAALGTPAYMAPEQAVADPTADERADLYSWGVVAYEVLTGRHPFTHRKTLAGLVAAHLTEIPVPLDEVLPETPSAVSAVIMQCLAKDPAERPRDAAELVAALELRGGWDPRRRVREGAFLLSEEVCRRLDRRVLQPQLIGDAMTYLENDAPSPILVFCLHGMAGDASDFTGLLRTSAFRILAPTLYGFEPVRSRRVPLSVEAHLALLRELLRDVVGRLSPKRVMVVGFSSGADLALRLVADPVTDWPRVDGCLALGPNLSLETCFASRVFAQLQGGDPAALMTDLRKFGSAASDLDEWINVMSYVLRGIQRFRSQVAPIAAFASGILRQFESGDDTFAGWFRTVLARAGVLRCVFEASPGNTSLIEALRLRNLDSGLLGHRYRPEALMLEPPAGHFALLESARIERHLAQMLAELESTGQ